jgi:hypothetical protein
MEIRFDNSPQHPSPQPPRWPDQERPQLQAPMVYVYEPATWEYKVVVRRVPEEALLSEEELNDLGSKGWELGGVATITGAVQYSFKRLRK